MLLRDEHFVNPDWLLYGKGTKLLMPTPKEMFKVNEANKSNSHYASSECMMICDAIKRRDPNRKEELVAKILMYINSLDIPLADTKDMTQKKE
ncbi:hypothetical protein MNB_SV-13-1037 [hydrothermal vent metagenome]|uniref:Uncharacterized protein n=1 Tax=hydrothermal vent metagenome TaxID=652676 RepID=A0A1W1D073_9ZZZZ